MRPMRKIVNKFLIGSDPELLVLDKTGNSVPYIPGIYPHISGTGTIGWDHGGAVLELRPPPSRLASTQVTRLKKLLQEASLALSGYKLRAGGTFQEKTLGGHLHFGVPYNKFFPTLNEEAKKTVSQLDAIVMELEALDILPKEEAKARRAIGAANMATLHYGEFGDIRESGHDNHLEYRTPPCWLHHPQVALVCLTLGKYAVWNPESVAAIIPDGKHAHARIQAVINRLASLDDDARRITELVDLKKLSGLDVTKDIRAAWRIE